MDKYSIRKLTEMSLTEQKSKLVDIVWSLAKISRGQNEKKALELGINNMKGEPERIFQICRRDKSSTIQTIIEKKAFQNDVCGLLKTSDQIYHKYLRIF